jgi:dihydroflavonol-4-reductase
MPRSRKLARVAASWIERGALRLGLDAPIDSFSAEMAACYWYLDAGKARAELGWAGRDASLTLYDTVEDMRARGVVWPRDDRRAAPSW